jgi:hypothetical protein
MSQTQYSYFKTVESKTTVNLEVSLWLRGLHLCVRLLNIVLAIEQENFHRRENNPLFV